MKRNLSIIGFAIICLSLYSQDIIKLTNEASKSYEIKSFEESIQLCENVLSIAQNDQNSLNCKGAVYTILHSIYLNDTYEGYNVKKSFNYLVKSLESYNKLVSEFPSQKKEFKTIISNLTQKVNNMPKLWPNCDINNDDDLLSKVDQKIIEQPLVMKQNIEEKVIKNDTVLSSTQNLINAEKTATITVSGNGKTVEEATKNALNSAVEQTFGTFISSKAEIFNDQHLAEEMSSVSSGNIHSYDILNESQFPNGNWGVTLKAIISIDKLTSFVEAKGGTVEFKGGLFAQNIKRQILNEQAEIKAIINMVGLLHEPMQTAFDYDIKSGDPKSVDSENKNWEIPLIVTTTANKNIDFCANYFIKTMNALNMADVEIQNYKMSNKKIFPVTIEFNGKINEINLRNQESYYLLNSFGSNWYFYTNNFNISNGIDTLTIQNIVDYNFKVDGAHYYNPKQNIFLDMYAKQTAKFIKFSIKNVSLQGRYDKVNFTFPSCDEITTVYNFNDTKTLNQIEKITNYNVNSKGIVSKFDLGGYVLYEKDGYGLVASISNVIVDKLKYEEIDSICKNLEINGYKDWRIPTKNEFLHIKNHLFDYQIGNLIGLGFEKGGTEANWNDLYLTKGIYILNNDERIDFIGNNYINRFLRPIRSFNLTLKNKQNFIIEDLIEISKSQFGFVTQTGEISEYYGDFDCKSPDNYLFDFNVGCGRGGDIIEIIFKTNINKKNTFDIYIPKDKIYFGEFTSSEKKIGELTIISENELKGNIRLCLEKDASCCGEGTPGDTFVMKKIK